jgi:hypothetical protein
MCVLSYKDLKFTRMTKQVSRIVIFQDVSGLNIGRLRTTVTRVSWYCK